MPGRITGRRRGEKKKRKKKKGKGISRCFCGNKKKGDRHLILHGDFSKKKGEDGENCKEKKEHKKKKKKKRTSALQGKKKRPGYPDFPRGPASGEKKTALCRKGKKQKKGVLPLCAFQEGVGEKKRRGGILSVAREKKKGETSQDL